MGSRSVAAQHAAAAAGQLGWAGVSARPQPQPHAARCPLARLACDDYIDSWWPSHAALIHPSRHAMACFDGAVRIIASWATFRAVGGQTLA